MRPAGPMTMCARSVQSVPGILYKIFTKSSYLLVWRGRRAAARADSGGGGGSEGGVDLDGEGGFSPNAQACEGQAVADTPAATEAFARLTDWCTRRGCRAPIIAGDRGSSPRLLLLLISLFTALVFAMTPMTQKCTLIYLFQHQIQKRFIDWAIMFPNAGDGSSLISQHSEAELFLGMRNTPSTSIPYQGL